MEPMLEEFGQVVAGLTLRRPELPLVSNVSGDLAGAEITEPGYWVEHVRRPVRFADGVTTLREHGVTCFLEAGPDAQLTPMIEQTLTHHDDHRVRDASADGSRGERPRWWRCCAATGTRPLNWSPDWARPGRAAPAWTGPPGPPGPPCRTGRRRPSGPAHLPLPAAPLLAAARPGR